MVVWFFVLEKKRHHMQKRMKKVNQYGLQNILDKFFEAISLGMWDKKTKYDI